MLVDHWHALVPGDHLLNQVDQWLPLSAQMEPEKVTFTTGSGELQVDSREVWQMDVRPKYTL